MAVSKRKETFKIQQHNMEFQQIYIDHPSMMGSTAHWNCMICLGCRAFIYVYSIPVHQSIQYWRLMQFQTQTITFLYSLQLFF